MSFTPDYAQQAQELSRQLESQAMDTASAWSDRKRQEYYEKYLNPYAEYLDTYVHGNGNITGMGLNDLLEFVSQKIDEFEEAAESSISGEIIAPQMSHGGGPRQVMVPSNFTSSDVHRAIGPVNPPNAEVPYEQSPEQMSERRSTWTVDYDLNSPGNFSSQNLRDILSRRRK